EVGHDRAPRRGGEKEKEDGEECEQDRIKKERQVNDGPIEIPPPKNSFYGEAAEPGRAPHSSVAVALWATPTCLATPNLARLTEARLQKLKARRNLLPRAAGHRARR